MKGKNTFTEDEARKIRALISEKLRIPSDKQVSVRNKIRKIGFYYTDFRQDIIPGGYRVEDFDELIETGKITIIK